MLAQAQQPAPLQPQVASFFIAENSSGTGNLGGIAGADQICQNEAQSLGGQAAARTWHAYLSQEQRGTQPRINARDRVGSGPWYNVKGQLIASNVAVCAVGSLFCAFSRTGMASLNLPCLNHARPRFR